MSNISNHARKRIRKRVGLPKKSVDKFVSEAMKNGVHYKNNTGKIKGYLDKAGRIHCSTSAGKSINLDEYRGYVFIVDSGTSMTVWLIPGEYRNTIKKNTNCRVIVSQ